MQSRFLTLTLVFGCLAAMAKSEPIVVDEADAELSGRWQSIDESRGYAVGTTFHYAMNIEEAQPSSIAIFRPNIPATGKYHVEIYSTPGKNRSPKVPCKISSAAGEQTVTMDQTAAPGGWHRVASNVQFNAGRSGFVQIANNGGQMPSDKIVIADGVRFVPTDDSASTGVELVKLASPGGRLVVHPDSATFESDAKVTITAEPEDGFVFDGWRGDVTGTANPITIRMDKAKKVGATFVEANPGAILIAANAEFTGAWIENAAKWGARTNYQYASTTKSKSSEATATYRPRIGRTGLYDIYIWYAKGANRSQEAPWEIVTPKKTFTVKVNQQVNGGDWYPIAQGVELEQGVSNYVRLSNITDSGNCVVVADSVAFVYVGGAKP